MAIKYALYPNPLTQGATDHRAIVQNQITRTIDDIIDRMITRGSTVTRSDALSVIEEYEAAIAGYLAEGDSINTQLFRINSSISGVFTDDRDYFDSSRHQINLNVLPGLRLQEVAANLSAQKVKPRLRQPTLEVFKDFSSDTVNDILTPGGAGELKGSFLKLNTDDPEQGVFFIASDTTEAKAESIIRNKPSNLIFRIPDGLSSGDYKLEVRSIVKGTSKIRSGRLDDMLSVA